MAERLATRGHVGSSADEPAVLNWSRMDPEQRLFFGTGGRFTQVNSLATGLAAVALTVLFYVALTLILPWVAPPVAPPPVATPEAAAPAEPADAAAAEAPATPPAAELWGWEGALRGAVLWVCLAFTERGPTQYATVFLTFWGGLILFFKNAKLRLQRRALEDAYRVVPAEPSFVLAGGTADVVLRRLHEVADDPRRFVLFNRILIALSNLKNLGRVSDVDDVLRSQADHDESAVETSYSVVSGFVWAIPVLGFIGTVLGLSQAIGQFGTILTREIEMDSLKKGLQGVTGGLATSFETTLVALVAALGLQLWLIFLKKSEEEFLDECSEYCLHQVVNRLRITSYEDERI